MIMKSLTVYVHFSLSTDLQQTESQIFLHPHISPNN